MLPFNNLRLLHNRIGDEINEAVQRVLASGWFVLGPEVERFEAAFAAYHGVAHAVGVGNGTDAIELALWAGGVGLGDEVITVAHTAIATVIAIERTGARPVLVDIDEQTYTIDPAAVEAAVTSRTKAIVAVHLYGQPADLASLVAIAERYNLLLVEDCAQAHGARYDGQLVGTFGAMAAFSFYPTKNLWAYGDGGAVITNDDQLAERLRRLRFYGQTSRYVSGERGVNSRLDELQAAILDVKLRHLDENNQERRTLASLYRQHLSNVTLPYVRPSAEHVYHLFVIRHPERDRMIKTLADAQIGTIIHYPVPVHLQQSHADLGYISGSLPVTERISREILSLPMYIGLSAEDVIKVATVLKTL